MHWTSWILITLCAVTLYEVFNFRRDFERIHKALDELKKNEDSEANRHIRS